MKILWLFVLSVFYAALHIAITTKSNIIILVAIFRWSPRSAGSQNTQLLRGNVTITVNNCSYTIFEHPPVSLKMLYCTSTSSPLPLLTKSHTGRRIRFGKRKCISTGKPQSGLSTGPVFHQTFKMWRYEILEFLFQSHAK